MKVDFLAVAEAELAAAVAHYNQESEGLGYEFAAEVRDPREDIPSSGRMAKAVAAYATLPDQAISLWPGLPGTQRIYFDRCRHAPASASGNMAIKNRPG